MTEVIPQKELETYKEQLTVAERYSTTLEVNSDDSYQGALIEGKKIKEQLEIIVSRKEHITKPLNSALKSVRDLFKPLESIGETALKNVKAKMISYTNEKERKATEAKAKIDARIERGTIKESTGEVKKFIIDNSMQKTVHTEDGSATTKKVKKYYITNLADVPLDFIQVDMVKVKASFKAGFPVPGTEERLENELALN